MSDFFYVWRTGGRAALLWRTDPGDPWAMVLELTPEAARGPLAEEIADVLGVSPVLELDTRLATVWPEDPAARGELVAHIAGAEPLVVGHWLTGTGGPFTVDKARELAGRLEEEQE